MGGAEMKKIFLFYLFILGIALGSWSCESPEKTWDEATQDLEKGLTGKGRLVEHSRDDVEVY
jgi:hypothetical protein